MNVGDIYAIAIIDNYNLQTTRCVGGGAGGGAYTN